MNDPDGPTGDLVAISAGDIEYIAGCAETIATELETTPGKVDDESEAVAVHLTGWDSAGTLNAVAMQWTSKTAALTHGTDGVREFAGALRQFSAAVTTTDQANATDLDTSAGVEAEFGGEYEPEADPDAVHQLTTGNPPPG